jgi:hypothetical protein
MMPFEKVVIGAVLALFLFIIGSCLVGCGHQIDCGKIVEKKHTEGFMMTTMVGNVPVMQWYGPTYKVLVRGRGDMDGLTRAEWFTVKEKVFNNHAVGDRIEFR